MRTISIYLVLLMFIVCLWRVSFISLLRARLLGKPNVNIL